MDAPNILFLSIPDKRSLCLAYMPFLVDGGLFIPTTETYHLGEQLFLVLNLFSGRETLAVVGRVVWITPPSAQNGRIQGAGIQFGPRQQRVRSRIEELLGATGADATLTI